MSNSKAEAPFGFAFVSEVSRALGRCELLHLSRQIVNVEVARQQHGIYVEALQTAGLNVTILPEERELPDSSFVEDPVLILDEVAVLTRLGSPSRRAETQAIEPFISAHREIRRIVEPGTLEGGDVLRVGKTLYVGLSSRTNAEGVSQLTELVRPFGYRVIEVRVGKCLHLKTGITAPGEGLMIANESWVDLSVFGGFEILKVPKEEPWGANTLVVNGTVFTTQSSPRSADLLEAKGLRVRRLDISELQKAEAGLTCLSVLF